MSTQPHCIPVAPRLPSLRLSTNALLTELELLRLVAAVRRLGHRAASRSRSTGSGSAAFAERKVSTVASIASMAYLTRARQFHGAP